MFFDLNGQKVLVVGGGEVALRKVALLLRSGAAVSVVAPEIVPEVMQYAAAGKLKLSPGTLYGAIKRMLEEGLVKETAERPDPEEDDEAGH